MSQVEQAVAVASQISFSLSKTVAGKRQELSKLSIFCPTLADFGINATVVRVEEDGSPVYETNEANWLYSAIQQLTKSQARNKFVPQTDTLRVGAKVAENLAELCAPTTGNKGAALVEKRSLLELFRGWLAETGKNEAVQKLLSTMLDRTDNLLLQEGDKRAKIKGYFEAFGEAKGDVMSDWQVQYLMTAIEACDGDAIDF